MLNISPSQQQQQYFQQQQMQRQMQPPQQQQQQMQQYQQQMPPLQPQQQQVMSLSQLPLQAQGPMTVQVPSQQIEQQLPTMPMQMPMPSAGPVFTMYILNDMSDGPTKNIIKSLESDASIVQMINNGQVHIVKVSKEYDEKNPQWLIEVPAMINNTTREVVAGEGNIMNRIKTYQQKQIFEASQQMQMPMQMPQTQQYQQPIPQAQYYPQTQAPSAVLQDQLAPRHDFYTQQTQAANQAAFMRGMTPQTQGPQLAQAMPQLLVGPSSASPSWPPSTATFPVQSVASQPQFPLQQQQEQLRMAQMSNGLNQAQSQAQSATSADGYRYVQLGTNQSRRLSNASSLVSDETASLYGQRYQPILPAEASQLQAQPQPQPQMQFQQQQQQQPMRYMQDQKQNAQMQMSPNSNAPMMSWPSQQAQMQTQAQMQQQQQQQQPQAQSQIYQALAQSGFPINQSTVLSGM